MNQIVETYGRLIDGQIPEHPQRAADLMTAAYSLVGMQASHFPSKKRMASREFLQGYTAKLMAKLLKDPSDSAIVNIFMPSEIFHALGIPVCVPEGLSAYVVCTAAERAFIDLTEEKGASGTLCSYHKVLLGCAEAGVLKRPMMVANTTLACDANQLTFRRLADKWRVPHVVIDVPYETDEEAVDYVAAQLRGLARTAEECCGRKLDEHKLKECVARSDESMKLYRRYLSLRSGVHFPETFTPELLGAISNKLYLGTEDALTYEKLLLKDVENAPRHTTERRMTSCRSSREMRTGAPRSSAVTSRAALSSIWIRSIRMSPWPAVSSWTASTVPEAAGSTGRLSLPGTFRPTESSFSVSGAASRRRESPCGRSRCSRRTVCRR